MFCRDTIFHAFVSYRTSLQKIFCAIILTVILASCAPSVSTTHDSNFPLTKEIAKSKATPLTVNIPQGWFTADDNETNLIDLWLIKDDYSATLNFILLNVDPQTSEELSNNNLNSIVESSKDFKKAKYGKSFKSFSDEADFEINKLHFAAYQYFDSNNRNIRVVVFKFDNKFYEFSAIPIKTNNLSELFKIQNSVLTSIQ